MKRYLVVACTLGFIFTAAIASAQINTVDTDRGRADRRAQQESHSTTPASSAGQKREPKATCAIPSALPVGPSPQAQVVQFTGAWGPDDRFNATLWREACPSDPSSSILYFRVVQIQGISFICGATVAQNGLSYDARFVRDITREEFCDDLPGPTTFVVDQFPDNPQFDNNAALSFTYEGALDSFTVALPPYITGNGSITPATGLWWNPAESGTGYALDVKHGVLVVAVYSFAQPGTSTWYLTSGAIVNSVFSATLDKYQGGQCISCGYRAPALAGSDGVMTINFSSPTTGTMTLPGGRVFPITPLPF
jgi:hypothetical protein